MVHDGACSSSLQVSVPPAHCSEAQCCSMRLQVTHPGSSGARQAAQPGKVNRCRLRATESAAQRRCQLCHAEAKQRRHH